MRPQRAASHHHCIFVAWCCTTRVCNMCCAGAYAPSESRRAYHDVSVSIAGSPVHMCACLFAVGNAHYNACILQCMRGLKVSLQCWVLLFWLFRRLSLPSARVWNVPPVLEGQHRCSKAWVPLQVVFQHSAACRCVECEGRAPLYRQAAAL